MKFSVMEGDVMWCNGYMCVCVWCLYGGEVNYR